MFSVLAAETQKALGNRKGSALLLAGLPALVVVLSTAITLHQLMKGAPADPKDVETAAAWAKETADVWGLPTGVLGRFVATALTAVVFGGEYGWNTWKLVVPHRDRVSLLTAKYLVVLGGLLLSFLLMAGLSVAADLIRAAVLSRPIPSGVSALTVLGAHTDMFALSIVVTTFTVTLTAAVTMLARSMVAGVVVGVIWVVVEAVVGPRLMGVHEWAYRLFPFHAMFNLRAWLLEGEAMRVPREGGVIADPAWVSLLTLSVWIAALIGVTVAAFRRQDLN